MFKKFITILTVIAFLCSVMSIGFTATATYEVNTLYGDVNGDGVVDTTDARQALELASGLALLKDEAQLIRSDVNFDGYITIFDARQILRGAAGLASLQPSGAFTGFEDNGIFNGSEKNLIAVFNNALNKIKVTTDENQYIAATITRTASDNLTNFNIKEVELPLFGNASAEGVASMVEESLTEDDKENETTIIPYGSDDFSLVSVENENYVSNLTASDIYGAKASYQKDENGTDLITIEIALPDTEIEMANQSAYAKVFDTDALIAEQDSTLMKLMKVSSGETAMFREFKNCVLKIVIDVATANVLSYTATYQSKVYVAQTSVGIGNTLKATLKGVEFEKEHSVKYEDFQWPDNK
ncbi:MAG: dockerin type I repeat-containing protein [Clostridia bacterium]|nr:dockerin type I repeat-containing protein [Clostridia bacterium]